jgi:hypothetical protein
MNAEARSRMAEAAADRYRRGKVAPEFLVSPGRFQPRVWTADEIAVVRDGLLRGRPYKAIAPLVGVHSETLRKAVVRGVFANGGAYDA